MSVTNVNILEQKKPLAFAKIQKFPERIKNKQSVALVQLQYRYICSFMCKHCAIERFKEKKEPLLSIKDVKNIADQADKIGLASICISGGEPLIFPDLEEVIKAINPERFVISIDTNGWLLDAEKVKWLVNIGVDRIHLSIDGLMENHDKFRGIKGSWLKCIKALDYCKTYGLGVVVNIVISKSLIKSGELIKQLEFLKLFDRHASLINVKPTGTFEEQKDEILDTEDMLYLESLRGKYNVSTHLSTGDFGCLCFKRHFSITAHGDVLPCPWIPISIGNVLEEPLQTIIDRGLGIKWFSFGNKFSCQSGNKDTFFYKHILKQVKNADTYPVSWKQIDWKGGK